MTQPFEEEDSHEPAHTASPTEIVLNELQLYGYHPRQDEPDPRPLPDAARAAGAIADMFDALVSTLSDTRLEPGLEDLCWGQVNLFHRAVGRIERELDDNEHGQRRSQTEQDGSEIRSVELERLTAEGLGLIERRNAMEFFRDQAAELYERHLGSPWRPRSGSMLNHRAMTAAVIDSREALNARRWADKHLLLPPGPRILFSGGTDYNDVAAIWDRLDKIRTKHPDMVLLHTGGKKGADRIADRWAAQRKVPVQPLEPQWGKYSNAAAPFKRNDAALTLMPKGVVIFAGGGIQDNLADKARMLGIPVWRARAA
jgi:hypothetical protein